MTDWNSRKVAELQDELGRRGLDTDGKKAELVARLEQDDANRGTSCRRLARTVYLNNPHSVHPWVLPKGTAEANIPADLRDRITNPNAWQG